LAENSGWRRITQQLKAALITCRECINNKIAMLAYVLIVSHHEGPCDVTKYPVKRKAECCHAEE
jgi:hypothetical protein